MDVWLDVAASAPKRVEVAVVLIEKDTRDRHPKEFAHIPFVLLDL